MLEYQCQRCGKRYDAQLAGTPCPRMCRGKSRDVTPKVTRGGWCDFFKLQHESAMYDLTRPRPVESEIYRLNKEAFENAKKED